MKDINPGNGPSDPHNLVAFNGKLFFGVSSGKNAELWSSDGTSGGTKRVMSIESDPTGLSPNSLVSAGGKLYFGVSTSAKTVDDPLAAPTYSIYRSDGTAGGTTKLTDGGATMLVAGANLYLLDVVVNGSMGSGRVRVVAPNGSITTLYQSAPAPFGYTPSGIALGGKLIFSGVDRTHGVEPWVSDGTVAGTTMIKDLNHRSGDSNPDRFTVTDDAVYFVTAFAGTTIWKTDGTSQGTIAIRTAASSADTPYTLFGLGRKLYFNTESPGTWLSDGTSAGTVKVSSENLLVIGPAVAIDSRTFFYAVGFIVAEGSRRSIDYVCDRYTAGGDIRSTVGGSGSEDVHVRCDVYEFAGTEHERDGWNWKISARLWAISFKPFAVSRDRPEWVCRRCISGERAWIELPTEQAACWGPFGPRRGR